MENFCWTVDLISWRVLFSRLVSGQCSGSGIDSVDQRVALLAEKPIGRCVLLISHLIER